MDELIKLVAGKAGISQDQARKAVETVRGFLKDKLPAPIAAQVDGYLGGSKAPDVGDLGKGLGGITGKKE